MAKASSASPKIKAAGTDGVRVTVVGAGLAGLTAALRLSRAGFKVTVYEAKETLGGNLSSDEVNGVYHDVYPHMFCAWYSNFWELLERDLGLSRDELFEARMGVKLQEKGSSAYHEMENATTFQAVLANLKSGVLPPPEMFLAGFSMLDLASQAFNRGNAGSGDGIGKTDEIDRLDVNGFIYSRGYATNSVAKLQNYLLMVIWSIQSNSSSAASYQDFIKHSMSFPHPTPFAWLLKGSLYEKIIRPLEQKVDCEIHRGLTVSSLEIVSGKPRIMLQDTAGKEPPREAPQADYVVLAVPGPVLATLVMTGLPGDRIVDRLPHLAGLQRFRNVAIPVVDVYFNKKLPGVPRDQVGFMESDFDLTILDISQLWTDDPNMEGRSALVVAASNGDAIPSLDPLERGHMMIQQLHDYLPVFEPGDHWGDPKSDICWEKTHYRSNEHHRLFIDDVGSWQWRPTAAYPDVLPNVFFAGDFCQTDVDMATVEAAVQSGLLAAQALQAQDAIGKSGPMGEPITIATHEVYSNSVFLTAKLALLPLAYGASAWSAMLQGRRIQEKNLPPDAYAPTSAALLLPMHFALDWWQTVYWLAKNLVADAAKPAGSEPPGETAVGLSTAVLDLGVQALGALGDLLQEISARQPPRGEPRADSPLASAFSAFARQAVETAQAAFAGNQAASPDQGASGEQHQRRWRVKP